MCKVDDLNTCIRRLSWNLRSSNFYNLQGLYKGNFAITFTFTFGSYLSASFEASNARISSQALVQVGFVVIKVADGQVFLRVIWFFSVSDISPVLHTYSLTCHQNYTMFDSW